MADESSKGILASPMALGVACAVVGVLAAFGAFNSVSNFPWIFALVCLFFGGLALWGGRSRGAPMRHAMILLVGVTLAVSGWVYNGRAIERGLQERRLEVLAALEGEAVPSLVGLEPLNTERSTWDEAASFTARATVVAFWARWCSPCWQEMEELDELYRQYRDRGLRVLAVTKYDSPDDEDERRRDFTKAQAFLKKRGHTFPAAITGDDALYRAYRVPGPPAMALIDHEGTVVDYAISLDDARLLMARAAEAVSAGGGS